MGTKEEQLLAEVARLRQALEKCRELFTEIRNDYTDPRSECREGWAIIAAALKEDTAPSRTCDATSQNCPDPNCSVHTAPTP